MATAVYTVNQIKNILTPILAKNGVRKAVLFGSYSKSNATEKSDVDLLVDSGLRGLQFVGLLDEIQSSLGKDVDLLDIRHIESGSPVDEEIRKTGVVLYEK